MSRWKVLSNFPSLALGLALVTYQYNVAKVMLWASEDTYCAASSWAFLDTYSWSHELSYEKSEKWEGQSLRESRLATWRGYMKTEILGWHHLFKAISIQATGLEWRSPVEQCNFSRCYEKYQETKLTARNEDLNHSA